ncbi:MAG: hypothetical protein HZA94_00130 [Candidatus Vogelbacteria bacterium]|nr:hypothetical protein [Candidatus Vogelbacteria bacterium]
MIIEDSTNIKPMTQKVKVKDLKESELLEKVTILQEAFATSGEREGPTDAEDLKSKFQKLLKEIPDREIRNKIAEKIEIYKLGKFENSKLLQLVENDVELNLSHYFDSRDYVKMARKELIKYRIYLFINEIIEQPRVNVEDLYKVARIAFDLNGLKALNDIGGHSSGDEGLRLFSGILKNGKTTRWLRDELGFEIISSAEGGDEFGIVISGIKNGKTLKDLGMLKMIKDRYYEEVINAEASQLINFSDPDVQERLKKREIRLPEGFKFRIGTSVGISTLGEAISQSDLGRKGGYKKLTSSVIGLMFKLADDQAIEHKSAVKTAMKESPDPKENAMYTLYTRMSDEFAEMVKNLKEKDAIITALMDRLKKAGVSYDEVLNIIDATRERSREKKS